MITLKLAEGMVLTLPADEAVRLRDELDAQLTGGPARVPLSAALDDDHPIWARHSGREGHDGPEWSADDLERAEAFYARVGGKARTFLDLLIDSPGRQLSVEELQAAAPGVFRSAYSVAGAINGLRLAKDASDRRYCFYWWEGTPTRYAMKTSVANLFANARRRMEKR